MPSVPSPAGGNLTGKTVYNGGLLVCDEPPSIKELEYLYAVLDQEEREEVLEELLVARARGGGAMAPVVDACLVDYADREIIDRLEG